MVKIYNLITHGAMITYFRCLYHKTEGMLMLFHHIVSISMMILSLCIRFSAIEVLGTLFGSEITSIFLNVSYWATKFKFE